MSAKSKTSTRARKTGSNGNGGNARTAQRSRHLQPTEQQSVHPVWIPSFFPRDVGTDERTFDLEIDLSGVTLCRVTVAPWVDDRSAFRLQMLLVQLPRLWRTLRDLAIKAEELEMIRPVKEAIEALWDTSLSNPFGQNAPLEREHTQAIVDDLMRARRAKLAQEDAKRSVAERVPG